MDTQLQYILEGNNTTKQMIAKPTGEVHKEIQTRPHKPPRMCKQTHKKCEHKRCWLSFRRARARCCWKLDLAQ